MKKEITSTLDFCRYYKGEEYCPDNLEGNAAMFWTAEQKYAEEMKNEESDLLDSQLEDYMAAGLTNFNVGDGVPVYLKAGLFFLFGKYNSGGMLEAAKDFSNFYINEYLKGGR